MYVLTNMMIFTHKSVKMTRANCMIFAIDVESDLYNWDPIQFILVLMLWVFTLVGEKLHLLVKNYNLKCKITFTFYVYFQYIKASSKGRHISDIDIDTNPDFIQKYFLLKRMFVFLIIVINAVNQAFWEAIYTLLAFLWFF